MEFKVMIPVDFSPVSVKAMELVAQLAEKAAIEAHLVHVIQVNEAEWAGNAEASDTLDQEGLQHQIQQASQQLEKLQESLSYPSQGRVLFGGLTTGLINYAAAYKPDLILMGTRGADGLLEKISGSEAQQIVRHAQVPVITVHEYASLTPLKNLLWVADFGAEQHTNKNTLLPLLQKLFGAKLHLLRIVKPADEAQAEAILKQMKDFAVQHDLENYELHLHRDYKVPQGVRHFNQATEMDLVIIGTHGRNSISQLFYGSIAETLVNHCIRPLITYHLK